MLNLSDFFSGQLVRNTSELHRASGKIPTGTSGYITHVTESSCCVQFFGIPEQIVVSKKNLEHIDGSFEDGKDGA